MHFQTSFGLLQTDQVNCYGQDGRLIDCALSGQDGAFPKTNPVAPDQRFAVMDRVVRDALTGAVWSRDANPAEFPLTWSEARSFVAQMRQDRLWGRDDWQLPPRRMLFPFSVINKSIRRLPTATPSRTCSPAITGPPRPATGFRTKPGMFTWAAGGFIGE